MPTRQTYNEQFLKILQQLNPAQQRAVEQIEGPVLVVAGPGTGKTHILSARIGRILMETDTRAYNILCLTFTDAGVQAMRERLLQFIGPEAHRVHIFTFHSFCNNIIQDYPALFGAHGLEPVSELEQIEILQSILDELPITHPLKRGRSDVHFYLQHLKDLFTSMKRENWKVEGMLEKIRVYLEDLPNRPEYIYKINGSQFKKGDLKVAQLEEMQEKMERLQAAVQLFPRYLQLMRRLRRYDYEDMILWVLQAFEKHPSLLRRYQEQYLYFLVDEYQDTNGAQNKILQSLMDFWASPNVFIVGDDDQSIYEFQGARLKNISDFYERYDEQVEVVLLTDNYRSTQSLLDTAFHLIEYNEKRLLNQLKDLGLEKRLAAQHLGEASEQTAPKIIAYPNRLQEAVDIVAQIQQLAAADFPLDEIAIIYARHRQIESIVQLLEKHGIPYQAKRKVNILELPLIANLRLMLRYLQAEYERPYSGEHFLYPLLYADFLQISANDLAKISLHLANTDRKERPFWRDFLHEIASEQTTLAQDLASLPAVQQFDHFLQLALRDYRNYPLPILLERILNRSGLLQFVLKDKDSNWNIQVLKTFVDFVQHEATRQPKIQIKNLLQTLNNIENNRLRLEVNKETIAEAGIQLLTAHSSKGLEFEKVFLIDSVQDYWGNTRRGANYRFLLPDTLTYSGEEDALEARRRLFYVGITRTKRDLQISFALENSKGKALQHALFIDEIIAKTDLHIQHRNLPASQLSDAQALLLLEVERPHIPQLSKAQADHLLASFRLSISSLNTYLRCPLSFFYEYVLQAPTLMSEAATYGEAMHRAWERLFLEMLGRRSKLFPTKNQFIRYYEEELNRLRHQLSPTEFVRRLEMGRKNLLYYYENHLKTWEKEVRVEFTIRNCEIEGVPVTGTIDKLAFVTPLEAKIVDYKTGKADAKKLKRPTKSNELGGNYYRQLVFYKLLFENYRPTDVRVKKGEIIFLDPNQRGNYLQKSITINAKDVQHLKDLIRTAYQKIQAHEFYEGCGEAHCTWCNFVQRNQLMDSLRDRAVEELDD
ncbi:MAG: ATP-dependent DNA helicase [Bacteroidota bacterium]